MNTDPENPYDRKPVPSVNISPTSTKIKRFPYFSMKKSIELVKQVRDNRELTGILRWV